MTVLEAFAGTENWLAARRGCLTASRVADALAVLRTGKHSEKRQKLLFDLLAERVTGYKVDNFVTPAMQWGIDMQASAISAYEAQTGELVGPEAFFLHKSIDWFGATPDGLVGDGLIEVKCPTSPRFLQIVSTEEIPAEWQTQMTAQCAVMQREWVDFVLFDPRVVKAPLWVKRFSPSDKAIVQLEEGVEAFLDELQVMTERFKD